MTPKELRAQVIANVDRACKERAADTTPRCRADVYDPDSGSLDEHEERERSERGR